MRKGLFAVLMVAMLLIGTAIPVMADEPGTGNSSFVIQNVDSAEANVTVDYFDQSGANDVTGSPMAIPGNGSQVFEAATLPVGDGWIGSVVVSADKQVAAVTNLTWQSAFGTADDQLTAASYAGSYQPSTELYFPVVGVKPEGAIPGKLIRFSIMTIQNAGSVDTTVTMHYYDKVTGAESATTTATIAPGRSASFNLSQPSASVPDFGLDWEGAVYVESDGQPIAGVVTTHWADRVWRQWAGAYEGVSSGSTALYAPEIFRMDRTNDPAVASWVRHSNLMVQNVGDATATINVDIYELGSTTPTMSFTDTIEPNRLGEYNTRYGSATNRTAFPPELFETELGSTFNGSAVVTSDQPIIAAVHTYWGRPQENSAGTYRAESGGSTELYVPYAPRKISGSTWPAWSQVMIQNLAGADATVTLEYYDNSGNLMKSLTDTIAGNSIRGYNTRFGSVGDDTIPASEFDDLGTNFSGNIRITSSEPIIGIASLYQTGPRWHSSYNVYAP